MTEKTLQLRTSDRGTTFDIRVVPNASRCELVLEESGVLKIRIDSPPVDGAANKRLLRFLAKDVFGISKGSVRLLQGDRGRKKTVLVSLDETQAREALLAKLTRTGR